MKSNLLQTSMLTLALMIATTFAQGGGEPLTEPVKSVYDHYLGIQTVLAEGSTNDVAKNAEAIARAIRGDKVKSLPEAVALKAEAIAKAGNLAAIREAFKPLSDLLVKHLADHKLNSNTYREIYCPMAEASWLQTGAEIKNPYVGDSMPGCGIPKRTF